ncbi:MAG: hypothetical protein EBU82_14585, partial [Flavobacteriia bacterium]|nr:hypothetical protein [Flavobacteriia bacterium]
MDHLWCEFIVKSYEPDWNRLSANPNHTVLLVEAGNKDKNPLIHIPGGYSLLNKTSVDWGFWSEPQE